MDTVSFPVGEWLQAAVQFVMPVIGAIVLWAFRQLPKGIGEFLRQAKVNEVLTNAIGYALNSTAGADKYKKLDVKTANAVVHAALSYAKSHAPELVAYLGLQNVREKILARLDLDSDATLPPVQAI